MPEYLCLVQVVYLTDEHQPDRTTSETPFFCYTHLLMKINVGAIVDGPKPSLDAPRTDGTDQQDAQLPPAYFDVSFSVVPNAHVSGKAQTVGKTFLSNKPCAAARPAATALLLHTGVDTL